MMHFQLMKTLAISAFSLAALPVVAQESPSAMPAPPAPNDAQIAQIVVTSNQVDIDAGKLAKSKTKDPAVKKFAQQMITDHTTVNKESKTLVKKLGVKPEESDASKTLKKGGEESEAKLKKLSGQEFDKAYVNHEVAYHEAVLSTIDNTLIPNAKNEQLKALIEKVRPAIEAHLKHAQMLQARLSGTSGGTS